jgi:hypothetical protein
MFGSVTSTVVRLDTDSQATSGVVQWRLYRPFLTEKLSRTACVFCTEERKLPRLTVPLRTDES